MNKMRVWWIPQVPGKPFYVDANSPEDGKRIMDILASYDLFQFENRIKPDYCNAGGIVVMEDGEWVELEEEDGTQA